MVSNNLIVLRTWRSINLLPSNFLASVILCRKEWIAFLFLFYEVKASLFRCYVNRMGADNDEVGAYRQFQECRHVCFLVQARRFGWSDGNAHLLHQSSTPRLDTEHYMGKRNSTNKLNTDECKIVLLKMILILIVTLRDKKKKLSLTRHICINRKSALGLTMVEGIN